jgi:hypothetical protein
MVLLVSPLALAGTITQTFTFSPSEVTFSKVNGYDLPEMRGYVSTSAPGSPIIPQAIFTFLVPANATVTNVEVANSTTTELAGTYNIHPAQTPRTLSEKRSLPFAGPDPAVYGSSTPFPGKLTQFNYTGTKTSYRLCGVSVFPLQYVPVTGKVILYTTMTLKVTYSEGSYDAVPLTEKQLDAAARELRTLVYNPEAVKAFAPPVRASDPTDAEYVIISSDTYIPTLQPLADWHSKKGYPTVFKTVAWITSTYPGYDNAEKIRNFVIDYYANHGTMYLLLAGSTSLIPSRRGYANVGGTVGNVPADLYYGDLQWSWDGNHNHVWGESNGDTVDFYYDVYVGRAPIASTANAQTLVNKVFGYEKNPNTAYIKKCYLPYVHLFSSPNPDYSGLVVSDTIASVTPVGWTDQEVNTPSTSAFKSAIDAGWGYCHAAAHGDDYGFYTEYGSAIYSTTQASAQTNGMDKLCVMNSMACISGNFENMSSLSVTLANNASGGTVANMLNSREGWGTPPSMGPSEKYNVRFYDFLINRDSWLIGSAVCRSKDVYANLPQSQEVWRWCCYDVNLLGDPGMPIWSDVPALMAAADPDSIPTGMQAVRVTVTSSGNPVPNASVGFYKSGEVCTRGITNSSGIADVLVNPTTVGKIYITVSAQDKLPLEDSARVYAGTAMPYMAIVSVTVDDAGGNGNGRLDPGETANLTARIRNSGTAMATNTEGRLRTASGYIAFVDSTSSYGNVAPSTEVDGDVYCVTASGGTPPGSTVGFTLHITATEGIWDPTFNLVVGQPQQPGALWADVDTGNCVLSVTALGSIGLTEPDGQGHGFKYPKAGVSKLYYSGLLIGNSTSYVVDHYYGLPASSVNTDFRLVDSVRQVVPPDMGDEEYSARMSDAGHSTPKGLTVIQRGLEVANPGYDDFAILVYDIKNNGATAINACYAGIMADFDIYTSTTPSDIARTNTAKRLAWMRGSNSANPTLGLRVLAPQVASNLSAIDHDVYVYPTDTAMSESMKYRFLNGQLHAASSNRNYDWSIVAATGPFDLSVGATQRVAFAVVGGIDTANFIANSDSAQSWYDHNSGIFEPDNGIGNRPGISFVRLLPNPFSGTARIAYVMPTSGRLTIRAYDAAGKLVSDIFDGEVTAGSGTINWQPRELVSGIYFLKAVLPAGVQTEKFLLTR